MNIEDPNSNKNSLFPKELFEDVDDESWQVSYLDIITIVLGFLIILLSASEITKSEFSSLSEFFGAFSDKTEYITTPIEDIQEELVELLKPEIDNGQLEITKDLNDLRIKFRSDDLYSSGNADLQNEAKLLLNNVLKAFKQTTYTDFSIDVEGHTDNTPISSESFPSNWELSTARASNVVKFFDAMGLEKERLQASGFADSKPIIQYDEQGFPFAASKETNRRVVLRLYYSAEGLKKRVAKDENSITTEKQDSNTEVPTTPLVNNEPDTDTESSNDKLVSDNAGSEPIPEEIQTQTPSEASNTTEISNLDSKIDIASFSDANISCNFSVELGKANSLSTGFQSANNIQDRTGEIVELAFNGDQYSIRTQGSPELTDALDSYIKLSARLRNDKIGIVHQCFETNQIDSKPLEYQIQFGAFQKQQNALSFTSELSDKYGIDTYMKRSSSTYTIVAGPYDSRGEVFSQLRDFKAKGIQEAIFIKPVPESITEYQYGYQLLIDSFPTSIEALAQSNLIDQRLGISSKIVTGENGVFYILSDQVSNRELINDTFDKLKSSNLNLSPTIFLLEYL